MPPGDVLARHTSAELTRWMAYEQATGPLSPQWRDDALAALLDAVRDLTVVVCRVNGNDVSDVPPAKRARQVFPDPAGEALAAAAEEEQNQLAFANFMASLPASEKKQPPG